MSPPAGGRPRVAIRSRGSSLALWAVGVVVLVTGVAGVRHGLTGVGIDFRSAVWAPGRSFLDGYDPYRPGAAQRVDPGINPFPVYGPPHLLLASFAGALPEHLAGHAWQALVLAIVTGSVALAVRMVTGTSRHWATPLMLGLVLLSRPGRTLVDIGQPTVVYLPLVWVVWYQRSRPWVAGLALALLIGKPPFFLPVLALLSMQRAWPVIRRGAVLGVLISAPVVAALLSVSAGHLVSVERANVRATEAFDHAVNRQRIDLAATLHHVLPDSLGTGLGAALALALGLAMFWSVSVRTAGHVLDSTPDGVVLMGMSLVTLLAVRHDDYDALLLLLPLAALLAQVHGRAETRLVGLALVPAIVSLCVPITTALKVVPTTYSVFEAISGSLLLAALLVVVLVRQGVAPARAAAVPRRMTT